MADVPGKFFSATKVRTGVAPSSSGSIVGEPLPPVNPPGSSLNSVGLTMPSAFTVSNSPLTANGTIGVAGAGTVGQYIRGDGSLADFPQASGGGSSVSYYLNGSISQGTIGGVAYKELNKVPILGAGTDFTINANGYIASFLTDAGDPNLLEIPGGNWNFETYFSASSGGGSPSFYVELYKYDGTTFTLIASSSSSPELIAFGTNLNPYFSTLAVPTTVLTLTDRLAIRYYVTHSGRTITLHTENNHLCQVVTTFTTGLTSLNGLTAQVQNLAVGTSGTDFNIASATATHTFNLPTASATNRGALSSADWSLFNAKQNALTLTTTGTSGAATLVGATLNIPQYQSLITNPVTGTGSSGQVAYWSSGSAITGESNLFWDATNDRLGIGLNNPSSLLHIFGAGSGNNLTYTKYTCGDGGDIRVGKESGVNNNAIFGTWSNNSVVFYANSVEAMRIFSGQNVHIGPTPASDNGARLQVSGNIRLETGAADGIIVFKNNASSNTRSLSYNVADASFSLNSTLGSQVTIFANNGSVTGSSFIKTGGTSSQFLKADGSVDSTTYVPTSRTITINGTSQDLSADRTYNVGTVTSVAALTLGTSGTDLSSTVANSTTTPVITLNVPTASATNRGALSAADWTTFNNKQNTLSLTTTGTSGAATLIGATLNIPQYQAAGTYVTSVTASSPLASSGGTAPNITIQQASGSQNGFLSSTDWTTFNNKQNALTNPVTGTGSSGQVAYFNGTTSITSESNLFWDATNDRLGIGTATPSNPLHIVSNTLSQLNIQALSGNTNAQINLEPSGTGIALIGPANNVDLAFRTNASIKLRLDKDGNLGLGVTPSAWSILSPAIEIGTGGSFISAQGSTSAIYIGTNAFFNGSNWIYKSNGLASYSIQNGGEHQWFRAASGTAGNAISFTQAMTLFSDGNLLVGSPSPITNNGARLQVSGTGTAATFETSAGINGIFNSTNASGGYIQFRRSGTSIGYLGNSAQLGIGTLNALELRADNNLYLTTTSGTLAMLSSGNVLIGTTNDNTNKLRVEGQVFINANTQLDSKTTTGVGSSNVAIANFSNAQGSTYHLTATDGTNYYRAILLGIQNSITVVSSLLVGTVASRSFVILSDILNMTFSSGTWTVKCTQIRTV